MTVADLDRAVASLGAAFRALGPRPSAPACERVAELLDTSCPLAIELVDACAQSDAAWARLVGIAEAHGSNGLAALDFATAVDRLHPDADDDDLGEDDDDDDDPEG